MPLLCRHLLGGSIMVQASSRTIPPPVPATLPMNHQRSVGMQMHIRTKGIQANKPTPDIAGRDLSMAEMCTAHRAPNNTIRCPRLTEGKRVGRLLSGEASAMVSRTSTTMMSQTTFVLVPETGRLTRT